MQVVIHLILYGRRFTRNETKEMLAWTELSMHQQIGRLAVVPPRSPHMAEEGVDALARTGSMVPSDVGASLAQTSGDVLLTQPSISSIKQGVQVPVACCGSAPLDRKWWRAKRFRYF